MYNIPYGTTPALYNERKELRRTGNRIGLSEVIGFGLAYTVIIFIQFAFMVFGADNSFFFGLPYTMLSQVIYEFLLCVIPFILCAVMLRSKVSSLCPLGPVKVKLTLPLIGIALGTSIIGSYLSSALDSIMNAFGTSSAMPDIPQSSDPLSVILSLLAVCFAPALMEEFAFRGIILGSLRKFGDGFAILMSALLFGMFHGNLVQIPSAFLAGLGLGYITVASGSMWPGIIAHFINNAIATLTGLLGETMSGDAYLLANNIVSLLMLAAGIVGFLLLLKQKPKAFEFKKSDTKADFKTRLKWFLTSPMIIVILILNVLSILFVQIIY